VYSLICETVALTPDARLTIGLCLAPTTPMPHQIFPFLIQAWR
jgi:hypothetical protein